MNVQRKFYSAFFIPSCWSSDILPDQADEESPCYQKSGYKIWLIYPRKNITAKVIFLEYVNGRF